MVKLPMKMKFKEHEIKIFNLYKGTKFWYVLIFVILFFMCILYKILFFQSNRK
jgi:hypothetical protein